MLTRIDLGKKGELLAQEHLLQNQYYILHTNWKLGRREVDIIASKDGCLVFVEVKTLSTDVFGYPEWKVNARKRLILQQLAEGYMNRMETLPKGIRFDIIAITFRRDGSFELVHIEDAF